MERVSQIYTSDVREVGPIREFVRNKCLEEWGDDPATADAIHLLALAVDEAATNIVLHAYDRRAGQPIELVVECEPDEVAVSLIHQGRDFDPATVPPPSYDGSRTGGFGVWLIQEAVDQVEYRRADSGQCVVHLMKRRPRPSDPGGSTK